MVLFCILFVIASANAQDGAPAGIPVVIENLAAMERSDAWVTFTVPDIDIPNGAAELAPQGFPVFIGDKVGPKARLVHVRVARLAASERLRGTIRAAGKQTRASSSVGEVPERAPPAANPVPVLIVGVAGEKVRFRPTRWKVVESGPARMVIHGVGRVPKTQFVVNMWFSIYTHSRIVPFEMLLTNCDPRVADPVQGCESIALETPDGIWAAIDFHGRRGGSAPEKRDGKVTMQLSGPTWFGHGQGVAWRGSILVWKGWTAEEAASLQAELSAPVVGMALNWKGHWGPWGVLPELHPKEVVLGNGQVAANRLRAMFMKAMRQPGSFWDRTPYGLNRRPSGTGDQQDFGVTKLAPALAPPGGNPFHLWELSYSVLWEASRPSYFYEVDGSPIRIEDHPKLVFWGLHPHWHKTVSPDRLGKKAEKNPFNHGIGPKDWGHISSNNLAGWTLLTGSYLGRHLCAHEAEGWLLGSRKRSRLGELRAFGRSRLAVTWHYLVTGDERIVQRLRERWHEFDYLFEERKSDWGVRVLQWSRPDGRYFKGKHPYWSPWHQALAIQGMDAAYQIAPDEKGARVLETVCRTHIAWGWWKEANGRWVIGYAVRYPTDGEEGQPLTPQQYRDANQAANHYGTAFDVWSWPAVLVARRWLDRAGDAALVAKCDAILAQLNSDRAAAKPPVGFDRASEWRAVR